MEIFVIIAAAILCCGLTVLLCRRYVRKAFSSIDRVLDHVLSKKATPETTGEDRLSKLAHKANRVVELCASEARQSTAEKETVQGFVSDLSHQMKTPLSGVAMYSDLLLSGNLSEDEIREFLHRIKDGTDKLQWLMDGLIQISRLETGAIQLAPSPEPVKQTVSDAIGGVVAAASVKNISVTVEPFDDIPLWHDRKWSREALSNLLENAVKYSAPDSGIAVSVEPLALYTKITVTDHGAGVERDERNMIFKRFYRGRNAKDSKGAGLGLYLAALIMEKQGGYIMVDSIPGETTSFSLFFQNCKN